MDEILCYRNTLENSKNHHLTIKYIKTRIIPNKDIKKISIQEFSDELKKYKTKDGNNLKYGSIKCLFYTMMKERSDWEPRIAKQYKNSFWTKKSHTSSNLYNTEDSQKIKQMILNFIKNYFTNNLKKSENEVAMAIIIAVATNLRMAEIRQLKKKHLLQIVNGEMINIKIKKKIKGVRVLSHKWLLSALLDKLPADMENNKLLITVSRSFINRTIKAHTLGVMDSTKLGIQSIRKVNTTMILEHCNVTTAQIFNRHTRSDTTQQYYNNKTYIGPQINQIMKLNHK
ncbi:VLF-1 [Callinectes sapidus nudivirus]|nr:VLF-1 [Callinectes sapidus nudivirus]